MVFLDLNITCLEITRFDYEIPTLRNSGNYDSAVPQST